MSLFSRIYQKVVVSIDLDEKTCKIRLSSNNKTEEKIYQTTNADFPIEAIKHIQKIRSKYPHTYISTMIRAENQGLLNGNNIDAFDRFELDTNALKIMLVNKKWFIYVGKKSLQEYNNKFSKVNGLDFVFSPFVIIYEKIKDRLDDTKKLYILQEKDSTSLLIADKNNIYFGNHIILKQDIFADENSFSELSIANHIKNLIAKTLNSFYQDSRYTSDFIDELLVLDGYGISDNAISYLKNNTILEIRFIRIDISKEIEKLAKMELNKTMGARYSFIAPKPKSIVSRLTKIWIFCIIFSASIIYLGGIYLKMKTNMLQNSAQIIENNINLQDKKIALINKNIESLQYEINLNNANKNYNKEMQSALLNLFALIPDQITITQIILEEKKLTLKGITPTRELYSFLLQAPLRSLFSTSRVDFFPLQNGWFNFTSISVLEAK